ncbi:MAG: succinate dehydrogenase cytochrome b subunit [Planctomycetales bacterium]
MSQEKTPPSKSCCNNWLIRAVTSSIGQKILMGLTGLMLCGFLVGHLSGNLLMYKGAKHYNEYAHFLHSSELLPLAEVSLLVLFTVHIYLGFSTARLNNSARQVEYAEKQSKLPASPLIFRPHNLMVSTGIVVLVFLIVHLLDMRFAELGLRRRAPSPGMLPFDHAIEVLKDPLSAAVYVVGSLVLGVHLAHGFQSAFRSIGFSHPKYTPFLKKLGIVFAIVIAVGFASLPIFFNFNSVPKSHDIPQVAPTGLKGH